MSERKPLVVGNWKMELSRKAEAALGRGLKSRVKDDEVQLVVCPSFASLFEVKEQLGKSKIELGAQNAHWEEKGAHTGSVSVNQIRGLATWCIVGHSEQRALTRQNEDQVVTAVNLLLANDINPILCLGETAQERDADRSVEKVTEQMRVLLGKITRTSLTKTVIAYEPIWAIGTGVTPDSGEAAAIMLLIRKLIAERFDEQLADRVRILYGGSVKPDNARVFMREPGVDGFLVGGASVQVMSFIEIVDGVRDTIEQ